MIKIIAGLGNPGAEYEGTRHNIGFEFLDRFARARGCSRWNATGRGTEEAQVCECDIGPASVRLVKPMSFMNRSGVPLAAIARFYKVEPHEIVVVHDEIDLKMGEVRTKCGGGDAGHNGIKSIVAALGSKDFHRVRLGVGRPQMEPVEGGEQTRPASDVASWVLGRFRRDESSAVDALLKRAEQVLLGVVNAEGSIEEKG